MISLPTECFIYFNSYAIILTWTNQFILLDHYWHTLRLKNFKLEAANGHDYEFHWEHNLELACPT